jgi:CRISPR-associated protein Cas2
MRHRRRHRQHCHFPASGPIAKPQRQFPNPPHRSRPIEARPVVSSAATSPRSRVPEGWWEEAFRNNPTPSERRGHRCGERQMLTIVAYDITEHKRLAKIAKICEDYGVRVQYSVFECRLEADRFDQFWADLIGSIDSATDRIVAYKVCAACARETRDAGIQSHQEKVVAYVF